MDGSTAPRYVNIIFNYYLFYKNNNSKKKNGHGTTQLWSREVAFRPGRFVAGRKEFTGDTGTAGYSLRLHLPPWLLTRSPQSWQLRNKGAQRC
jgi:hypothetical protein